MKRQIIDIHSCARILVYQEDHESFIYWELEILSNDEWAQNGDTFTSLKDNFDDAIQTAKEHAAQMLAVAKTYNPHDYRRAP